MISGNKNKKQILKLGKKKSFFLSITINKVIKIESYKKERIRLKKKKKNQLFNLSCHERRCVTQTTSLQKNKDVIENVNHLWDSIKSKK